MANISDALGRIKIEGDWSTMNIEALIYLLQTQSSPSDYCIYINEDFNEVFEELSCQNEINFNGSGRWCFEANLKYLHNWSIIDEDRWNHISKDYRWNRISNGYKINYNDYLELRDWLFQQMYMKQLKIVWEFVDMDPAMDWLSKLTGEHKVLHSNGTYTLEYTRTSGEDYDCNLKTYTELLKTYDADMGMISDAVDSILHVYDKPKSFKDKLKKLIEAHPTWYNISVNPYYDSIEELPEELQETLKTIFVEVKDGNSK